MLTPSAHIAYTDFVETETKGSKAMIKVTYKSFSKVLNKEFINVKYVNSMDDFKLFASSLNLHYSIISREEVV